MSPSPSPAGGMPAGRVFRVAYSTGCEDDDTPRLHHTRDGDAALELVSGFTQHGYTYDSALHFYPNFPRPAACFSQLTASDLLLVTTRPPIEVWLNQGRIPPSRRLIPGGNDLETAIFSALAPFFSVVSRYAIEVSSEVAPWLNELGQEHAALEFTRYGHALITYRGRSGEKHAFGKRVNPKLRHTAGYFVKLHSIPQFGCGLVCCFAPGGVENLLFARYVRQRRSAWLAPSWQGFGFVRFAVPTAAEDTPLSAAEFDDQIDVEILAEHTFAAPPARG